MQCMKCAKATVQCSALAQKCANFKIGVSKTGDANHFWVEKCLGPAMFSFSFGLLVLKYRLKKVVPNSLFLVVFCRDLQIVILKYFICQFIRKLILMSTN